MSTAELRVRLGTAADIDRAVDVYRRSNLARRKGVWPNQVARVEQVRDRLADQEGWFMVAEEDDACVGMAAVVPLRADDGDGPPVPGACFLSLLFVIPERWGQGVGGRLLAVALDEAALRACRHLRLWTDERDNERAHRLYRRRGLQATGRTWSDDEGTLIGEWARDLDQPPTS